MTASAQHPADTVVYTPESQLRSPIRMLGSMWTDLKASRELSWHLFLRDFSAHYRQSVFGILWAFVPPIVTSLVFIALRSRNVVNLGEVDIPYPVYVVVGTILWQIFVESFNAPLKSVTAARPMLSKVKFPREALILSSFYFVLHGVAIKLLVMMGVLVAFGYGLGWNVPLALLPMMQMVAFGMVLGLLITPVGMLYSDIASALPVITQLLFFVTPVVYVPPTSFPFSLITVLNPVSPMLIASRDLLTKGSVPDVGLLLILALITSVGVLASWIVYRVALPILIERVSA